MESPLISICLPTHNRAAYLAECMESVLAQTYTNWECIVYDDASTDSTPDLMAYYTQRDPRISYFLGRKNIGVAEARNSAISRAKGAYIAVMDSDDIMSPERLKVSLKAIQRSKADVVYGSYLRADEHAKVIDGVLPVPRVTLHEVQTNQLPAHVTIMAKASCFRDRPYRGEFVVNDDQALLQDWWLAGYTFKGIKDPLVIVRFHDNSISSTRDKEVKKTQTLLRKELDAATK